MTYFRYSQDNLSYNLARAQSPCNCPLSTPIAIKIPSIDIKHLTPTLYDLYSESYFILKGYCVRCRTKFEYMAPIYRVPPFDRWERHQLINTMVGLCHHTIDTWYITEPIETATEVLLNNNRMRYIVYCSACRRVFKIIL